MDVPMAVTQAWVGGTGGLCKWHDAKGAFWMWHFLAAMLGQSGRCHAHGTQAGQQEGISAPHLCCVASSLPFPGLGLSLYPRAKKQPTLDEEAHDKQEGLGH